MLGTVVSELCHVHQIVSHSRHQLAGLVTVKVAEGKSLKMREHLATHLGLHTQTHNVSLVLNEVVEHHSHKVEHKQNYAGYDYVIVLLIRNVVIEHRARHDRIDDTEKRDQKRRQKIESKYLHVRLVVGQEAF